ncbi:hypothetical protein [uncultured Algibacter sp.]|uniref:hypothetical protein n=1 Tax=uncultured Algibacter sp. TaxID=298659 RepID=UPI0032169D4A
MIIGNPVTSLRLLLVLGSSIITIISYSCNSNKKPAKAYESQANISSTTHVLEKTKPSQFNFQEKTQEFLVLLERTLIKNELEYLLKHIDLPIKEDNYCFKALLFPEQFDSLYDEGLLNKLPSQIDKKLFINKIDLIFSNEYIKLLSCVNLKKSYTDTNECFILNKDTKWNISININEKENEFRIFINQEINTELEFSNVYLFKYQKGKFMLTEIYCIG